MDGSLSRRDAAIPAALGVGLASTLGTFAPAEAWAQAGGVQLAPVDVRVKQAKPPRRVEPRPAARPVAVAAPVRRAAPRRVVSAVRRPGVAAVPAGPSTPGPGTGAGAAGPATGGAGSGTGGGEPSNALNASPGIARLPGRVQDIPQVMNVVPRETLQAQNVTTLEQALRNVPGITVSSGEGNGGQNGDQFRLRGFQAKNDIYVDGLRDFGVYVRDSFNVDSVQVIKGPSSEVFGAGTTGGAINTVSKRSFLGSQINIDGSFGTGPLARATVDVNQTMSPTSAIRLNAVVHGQQVADRDNVHSDRWGVAASLGFGLGTDLSWHLNYFHQHNDRRPDYGVPTVQIPGTNRALPATEFGLGRRTSFVRSTDRDIGDIDLLTSLLKWQATDWLTVYNDTRLTRFDREFSSTAPTCNDTAPSTCRTDFFRGRNPFVTYSAGGGLSYDQDAWGVQNVTSAVAKFHTGFLRHEFIAGVDIFYNADERTNGIIVNPANGLVVARPSQLIRTPIFDVGGYAIRPNPLNRREADATDLGLFATDRVWFTDQLSVQAGVRYDDFRSSYRATNTTTGAFTPRLESDTQFVSPKVSLILEPTREATLYMSYARSFTPPGLFVTTGTGAELPTTASGRTFEPEKNDLYEVGAKLNLLNGRLGLTAALFRIDKSNSFDVDPVTGAAVVAQLDGGDTRRVQGFEFSASGRVTERWNVQLSYAHFDSRVLESTVATNVGNRAPYVPENAFSVFTTYDIPSPFASLPGKFVVGGGVFFDDGYFPASDNVTFIPGTFQLDSLIAYETKNVRIALNGYNLTDELNYTSTFSTRAVPSSGRTFTLSVGARF